MRLKEIQAVLLDPSYVLSHIPRATIYEVLNQYGNISPSFSQRGNLDRKNIEPVKQVATKGSGSDGLLQVAVRGSNHSHICLDGSSSPATLEFVFLQDTQQRDLRLHRKLSNLISAHRATLPHFYPAH